MSYLDKLREVEKYRKAPPPAPTKPTEVAFVGPPGASVGSVGTPPAPFANIRGSDYTSADLQEIDRLLAQLAEMEGWTEGELAEALDCRRRMAPARVLEVLGQLRKWAAAALAPWPDNPPERPKIVLTVFDGDKGAV